MPFIDLMFLTSFTRWAVPIVGMGIEVDYLTGTSYYHLNSGENPTPFTPLINFTLRNSTAKEPYSMLFNSCNATIWNIR